MGMMCKETALPGVLLFEPQVFGDDRGFFQELYHEERYVEQGVTASFVQDNWSRSETGVLRGLHYQLLHPQAKLVTVLRGRVFDVAVDLRRNSPTFAQWLGVELSESNHHQLYIPEGFAHGFCVLEGPVDFLYKCSALYDAGDDRGVRWNDPRIGIDWPVHDPSISPKDAQLPFLDAVPNEELPEGEKE